MRKILATLIALCLILTSACALAAGEDKSISILWSSGGNGNYVDSAKALLEAQYGLNVSLEYNAKAHEVLQPQIVAGNPPDITMVQHSFFNFFDAIEAGAFLPVDQYLDLPVGGGTVGDVANPDILESMKVDGVPYLFMSNMNVNGLYYDKAMFDRHGWQAPETWDEFVALCETIKATTDIAPFIYPGMYPYYMNGFIFPMVAECGRGAQSIADLNNMKAGAWNSPEMLEVAQRLQLMRDKGYFAKNLIGLNHTESQMEFVNGRVAMIAAGSWLENEMGEYWPEGFELTFLQPPGNDEAGEEKFLVVTGNFFGFPAAAKNPAWNGEFLQAYYAPESALAVARDCGVVISPAMVAESEEVRAVLKPSVVSSYLAANESTKLFMLYSMWYAQFHEEFQNQITALISGDIDAQEFVDNLEKNAQEIREDDFITKYQVG